MAEVTASQIGQIIADRLGKERERLTQEWSTSQPVTHFIVDDLLPVDILHTAVNAMPSPEQMLERYSLRENKRTSSKPEEWGEACKAILYGLHEKNVLKLVAEITGIKDLLGDGTFYGSGVSWMGKGSFLNPHLDNSGHPSIKGYRRLNALFYVSPNWSSENGGNLELWSLDRKKRVEVVSKFNRLVIMNTNRQSLHSVNAVQIDAPRLCLSNYYFTVESPHGEDYSHITSFRGRPDQPLRDFLLKAESILGSVLVRLFPRNPNKS